MDKQDAIDFIVQEHENGLSAQEIAASLSAQMNAPLDVVARFVNRTLEQRQGLMGGRVGGTEAAAPPDQPRPPAAEPYRTLTSTPKWRDTIASAPEGTPFAGQALETPEQSAEPEEPAAPDLPDVTAALREQVLMPEPDASRLPPDEEIDPRLEKFILDLLNKNGKRADVVMAVCERAAVDWKAGDRMVTRVETKHHKKISARRNAVLIPFSLTFIAIGLGLTFAGVSELAVLRPFFEALLSGGAQAAVQEPLPVVFNTRAFWALGIGTALIVGGILGVIQAIRAGATKPGENSNRR